MILVDSCGWLEYFSGSALASTYYQYLKRPKEIITPTIVLYEIYKKIKKDFGEEDALLAASQTGETIIVPLTESIALTAADYSLELKIPMADAIVYATAAAKKAKIVTSDAHFKHLENVVFIDKKS
ncbi:MAG: type II toxin-antitoxin system VapC family toxin [Candidatus Margulisiibacteriota bacterium]